jgi:ABC-type glycerol-3-phosphate transport system substrate-binding protein
MQDQNIFDANQVKPISQPVGVDPTPVEPINKEKIIGRKRFPKELAILSIGLIALLIIVGFIVKIFGSRLITTKQNVITWWSLEEDVDAVNPIILEYEKQHPNIKIQFISQSPQDYFERLSNSLTKNTGPDIFEFHNSWVSVFRNYLDSSTEDFSSIFYPVATTDLKTKNGFWGIPLEYNGIALFVNEDILHLYNKNIPKTWDDLRKIAQELTLRDANGTIQQSGAAIGVTSNVDYWQDILALLMLQNGADLRDPTTISGQSALTFLTNLSKVDRVWDETLPHSTAYFASGKLAFYFGSYRDVFTIQKQNPSLHFAVVPLPQLPSPGISNSVSYANYWVNGVSKNSANTIEAHDFLKFMSSPEVLRQLYLNEKKVRGYGNLYPRVDMQKELLTDNYAAPFIYQASFAKSWYLNANTNDGVMGINSQVAKPYMDAINAINGNTTVDQAVKDLQTALNKVLIAP